MFSIYIQLCIREVFAIFGLKIGEEKYCKFNRACENHISLDRKQFGPNNLYKQHKYPKKNYVTMQN